MTATDNHSEAPYLKSVGKPGKIRIYVSLPITGRDLEKTKQRAESIKRTIQDDATDVITPFDVAPEVGKPYSYYMGKCIEALLDCSIVYFADDWVLSKGCQCEHATAKIYGKCIIYQGLDGDIGNYSIYIKSK